MRRCAGWISFFVAVAFVFGFVGIAAAAPTVVGFSGVIDFVDDPSSELPPGIGLGTPFAGTYTLDPDLFGSAMSLMPGFYQHENGPGSLDILVGGFDFSRPIEAVFIGDGFNDPTFGPVDFWSIPLPLERTGRTEVSAAFTDTTLQRISEPSDFFVNTSLDGWDGAHLFIHTDLLARGRITELTVIPEPSTALLVASGLVGFAAQRRRPRAS